MRIAVYTICRDEGQFVERWYCSAKDADYILVADTGSTDDTLEKLQSTPANVATLSIKPWRFDDARNAALALLPPDIDVVIALDMDEILVPGWRQKLEACWTEGTTRLRYRYIWSWTQNGEPDLVYHGDKITGRATHRWKHPVHEVMVATCPEVVAWTNEILIEHHPDSSKPRSQYLPLLRLSVVEDPTDDRNAHYLGRELFYYGLYDEAIAELKRHLELPRATWIAERAASMRYIARCYEAMQNTREAHQWFIRAGLEDPDSREVLVDAARFSLRQGAYHATIDHCERAMKLPQTGSYMCERYASHEGPYDLAAVAYFQLGDSVKGRALAETAVQLNPHDPRLQTNLAMMSEQPLNCVDERET